MCASHRLLHYIMNEGDCPLFSFVYLFTLKCNAVEKNDLTAIYHRLLLLCIKENDPGIGQFSFTSVLCSALGCLKGKC